MTELQAQAEQLGARKTALSGTAKWLVASLICLVLTTALLEALLPLLHRRYAPYFRQQVATSSLRLDDARRFVGAKTFDSQLGWNEAPSERNFVPGKQYVAQSYGDSFVKGDGVGPEETWQAHFEKLTGNAILNLGVGGYGLDQAVLKFEKYAPNYPTRIALLGLYPHMYRRMLSYHSFYYFPNREGFVFAFKPIFVNRAQRFELIPPPCVDAACLVEVLSNKNSDVWQDVARYDYWYHLNQEKPVPGFPNTIKYVQVLQQIRRTQREYRGAENYFFVNATAFDLAEYLIQRFVNEARAMGMTPVCVMLYSPDDLRVIKSGIRLDDKLLNFLASKGIPHLDTSQYILNQYSRDDRFESLSVSGTDRHMNSQGNRLIAEALARGLGPMAMLGD